MVAYPYTKLMTAIMDVDMAAALVLASAAKADALGVPEEQRVYLRGSGYAEDPSHVAGHPDLWRSPAMAAAAGAALARSRHRHRRRRPLRPVLLLRQLGVLRARCARDRPRGRRAGAVTQTGGLPYHGGPGSNYMTHALAAMVETLRRDPGSYGVDERRRHAHAEARLRGVVDRPRRRSRPRGGACSGGRPTPSPSSSHPRGASTVRRPIRSCTVVTAGPQHALLICDLPAAGPRLRAARRRCGNVGRRGRGRAS